MTTYTLTATRDGETTVFTNKTAAEIKTTKKNLGSRYTYKTTKNVIRELKQCYHNDTPVTYIEDQMNNWTLVYSIELGKTYRVPTREISFR